MAFRVLIVTFLFKFISPAFAQTEGIKVGAYSSFYSFIENRPIPGISVSIVEADNSRDRLFVPFTLLRFEAPFKIKRKEYAKSRLWGFYDGNNLYISSKNYTLSTIVRFSKILHLGRYAYFRGTEEISNKTNWAIGGLIGTIPIGSYFVLDMSNGDVFPLTIETLKIILRDNPDLYQKLEKDPNGANNLLKYIEKFNSLFRIKEESYIKQ
ncbi:hypothetical protein OKW21_000992 [Catalinimonas alkaloidigena]|uniref:hypothetical protein n=1 Tax=Catalinimonas alkaloidigena TaxID=1075417 RepID=UPI002405F05F|nr:hypothetical protein [Catalinimonas alkaloidigena]MDF9795729.1 hypothetical protein [Catalinimonas alkaloidigena]